MTELENYYRRKIRRSQITSAILSSIILAGYTGIVLTVQSDRPIILAVVIVLGIGFAHWHYNRKYYQRLKLLHQTFPEEWVQFLVQHSLFYRNLKLEERQLFNERVLFFLSEKKIEGIDVSIDDSTRLLVAASAIIPTFAFPYFEYPDVEEVLIYPNSFDEEFQTSRYAGTHENITGMVGNRFMNKTVILSKPDLIAGFDGTKNKSNVGVHEFVHLIDKIDGAVDGVPDFLLDNAYVLPWLQAIKEEMLKIERGRSDINPYALTNNAEFLAVVSEYFFNSPHEFHQKHPELYQYMVSIFHQNIDEKS